MEGNILNVNKSRIISDFNLLQFSIFKNFYKGFTTSKILFLHF